MQGTNSVTECSCNSILFQVLELLVVSFFIFLSSSVFESEKRAVYEMTCNQDSQPIIMKTRILAQQHQSLRHLSSLFLFLVCVIVDLVLVA